MVVGSAEAQGVVESNTQKLDTRIMNISYWLKMVELGLVEPSPEVPHKAAVYTSSIIEAPGVLRQDSPDIPVTTYAYTTQSENSIFVHPDYTDIVLNSNNSTDWDGHTVKEFYGADYFYSFDYGQTWEGSIYGAGGNNGGDPAAAIGRNGWYYVGYLYWGQQVAYSTDNGIHWTRVEVTDEHSDKGHLWVDNSLSSPYEGNLYCAWTNWVAGSPDKGEIEFSRSIDSGISWSPPDNISSGVSAGDHNLGVNIQTGPNGNVYAAWALYDYWPADENAIGFAKSTDGGETFEDAVRIIENIRGIRHTGTSKDMRVNSCPVMAVDISGGPNNGNIYLVWANIGEPGVNVGPDIDVYMIKSTDEGSNWSDPLKVNQDPSGLGKEHYFPWITCDPITGDLHVIFYDDRNVARTDCEVFVATSRDGGATWYDFKVSDVSFTPAPILGLVVGYFGDYLGISARAGKVYPAWTDNRDGRALTYVSPFNVGFYGTTDDPLALAFNGNRHLAREPNTENLHLIYTNAGQVIYRFSDDGGEVWTAIYPIGDGELPALCLDREGNPCVSWVRRDCLCFSRKDPVQGWTTTYYPFGTSQPFHPCITVTPSRTEPLPDTGHILVRLFNDVFSHNSITEVSFPVTDPQSYQTRTLEASMGANMITLDFPSAVRDFNNTLHATWMHADTLWYGTRAETEERWNVWGWQFQQWGRQSAHPFVETYGDSIFVVWQNEANEEVYRGARHLQDSIFQWQNLSLTPTTPSIYPVNASGMITTFVDKESPSFENDIFWKMSPEDPLHNLSSTREIRSIFPHASLRTTQEPPIQYTVWQEGNDVPYEIKFERASTGRESPSVSAYFNSIAGFETPSMYLVERDTFISNWQIPVDIGDNTLKYEFPLEPGYTYKAKIIAYHEAQGPWQAGVRLDGGVSGVIQYNAFQPETLEVLVPPALYQDSLLEVEFELVSGGLAMGPVHIYQYEDEPGGRLSGGPQSAGTAPLSGLTSNLCNIFKGDVRIDFALPFDQKTEVTIYDAVGRILKKMKVSKRVLITEKNLAAGVYFLRVENPITGKAVCWKFVKIK
jgi:hypothetical protein